MSTGTYWKHEGLLLSTGNVKVHGKQKSDVILILNMGSAINCSSRALGCCICCNMDDAGLPVKCYRLAVELWLASIKNYSLLQETYWRTHTAAEICNHIDAILQKGKRAARVKGFRFNESGEVMSLDDILKANTIAKHLRSRWGIKKIWTYTARIDLREHCDNLAFVLKGSGFLTKDGATMIIVGKSTPIPQGFRECPGNCGRCSLCAVRGTKIVFRAHGGKTNISKDITREEGIAAMFKFYPELSHLFGDIETMLKAA